MRIRPADGQVVMTLSCFLLLFLSLSLPVSGGDDTIELSTILVKQQRLIPVHAHEHALSKLREIERIYYEDRASSYDIHGHAEIFPCSM